MGVFDRFNEKEKTDVEVYPETQDFGEGMVSILKLCLQISSTSCADWKCSDLR